MKRRSFVAGAVAALAAPSLVRAESQSVLKFIPQSDVTALDPVWSTVYVTRNHGYMVFDTLYGQAVDYSIQPQMVEGHTVEQDGLAWRLRLRDGLIFHDNTPVLARDCVASIKRWTRRDLFGQTLMQVTDELSAPDDRTIQFRLKRPFPMLPEALGKVGGICAIMPERLAATDPFKQVPEMVGSGPFRFVTGEREVGARVVYEKFDKYRPRESGTPDCTSGPKIVHFDRVVWNVIPDPATAAAAMQRGEADWWEQPIFDLIPTLQKTPGLVTPLVDVTGNIPVMRMNQLFPPFDNPDIRRALWMALDQSDYMAAVVGDAHDAARTNVGFFAPDTPMASEAGLEVLKGPRDVEGAKRAIAKAGYKGEKVVVMTPSDYPRIDAVSQVGADMLRQCGFNVELQAMDWGSVIQRRTSKAPIDKGGWSVFSTTFTGADMSSPASEYMLRGNGKDAWFGWPDAPEIEKLRDQWLAASDLAEQRRIAARFQQQNFVDVPLLPLGQFFQPTVRKNTLVDGLTGLTLFWNIRRA